VLFLLAFAYHSRVAQPGRAWLALALALTVKEDMWVYAAVTALLVASRERAKHTVAFLAGALGYYVVAVLLIGGTWYPAAKYFNSFYESDGQALTLYHPHLTRDVRTSPDFPTSRLPDFPTSRSPIPAILPTGRYPFLFQ